MATTAASIGTPQPRKRNQANLTAAKDVMGARKAPQKRQRPYGGQLATRLKGMGGRQLAGASQRRRAGLQAYGGQPMRGGGGGPSQFGGQPMRGRGGPAQFQGPQMPGGGGGGGGFGGYPGSTNWWGQRPQMPGAQQWGSPRFNYQGGYAPSAQQGPSPPWGGGGPQQMPGQYQTGGRPYVGGGGQQGYGGGMPRGGMPSYQMPGMQNTALGPLQNRTWDQRMQNYMPSRVRQQYGFQGAAAGLGFDPNTLPGYGTEWGSGNWGQQQNPWTSRWGSQPYSSSPWRDAPPWRR